jgi:formate dehydrogenase iron-sulfur subunit
MSKAVLFDSTLCVGCKACDTACAERWGLPYDDKVAEEERLSARKMTAVALHGDHFIRRLCMHCNEPTCASVCPVNAFKKTALGPVIYEAEKCMGCRYCMTACPFGVPSYEWNKRLPVVTKCDMCYDRQLKGEPTTCSEACPMEATVTGERDEILALAQQRIAGNPEQYYPKIYGLKEAGGTAVFFLSAVPFEQLGLRTDLPDHALGVLTWRALSTVPDVVAVGSVLLGGVYWITSRREEVARKEGRKK